MAQEPTLPVNQKARVRAEVLTVQKEIHISGVKQAEHRGASPQWHF